MSRLIPLICLFVCLGCTSTKSSNTARTATEQLLISNAVDESLSRVNFAEFAGQKVYLEEKYMDSVDKNYVLASVRHRLMLQGTVLMDKKEDSDITIEMRSGGIGTNQADMFVGVPEITVPGMLTLPEVRLITKGEQSAVAKLGMNAYETKSGQILGLGGVSLAEADRKDWFFLGVGPYQNGSLVEDVAKAKAAGSRVAPLNLPNSVAFRSTGPQYSDYSDYAERERDGAARVRLTSKEEFDR